MSDRGEVAITCRKQSEILLVSRCDMRIELMKMCDVRVTSCLLPSGLAWDIGANSTMYSQMERRQSISRFHIDLFSGGSDCNLWQVPNTVAAARNN